MSIFSILKICFIGIYALIFIQLSFINTIKKAQEESYKLLHSNITSRANKLFMFSVTSLVDKDTVVATSD